MWLPHPNQDFHRPAGLPNAFGYALGERFHQFASLRHCLFDHFVDGSVVNGLRRVIGRCGRGKIADQLNIHLKELTQCLLLWKEAVVTVKTHVAQA